MDSKEQRSALRAAVYRGDGRAVVDLLRGVGAEDDSLQLAGDGLRAAVDVEYLNKNPMEGLKLPKDRRERRPKPTITPSSSPTWCNSFPNPTRR